MMISHDEGPELVVSTRNFLINSGGYGVRLDEQRLSR